jgi:fructoselysine-6-P-deglycase FrlB-like protein
MKRSRGHLRLKPFVRRGHESMQNTSVAGPLRELRENGSLRTVLEEAGSRTDWLFLGRGTSFYRAEAAAASWTLLTGQPARPLPASELLFLPELALSRSAGLQAVIISRSGRTSEALRSANLLSHKYRVPTLGVTCATASPQEIVRKYKAERYWGKGGRKKRKKWSE